MKTNLKLKHLSGVNITDVTTVSGYISRKTELSEQDVKICKRGKYKGKYYFESPCFFATGYHYRNYIEWDYIKNDYVSACISLSDIWQNRELESFITTYSDSDVYIWDSKRLDPIYLIKYVKTALEIDNHIQKLKEVLYHAL